MHTSRTKLTQVRNPGTKGYRKNPASNYNWKRVVHLQTVHLKNKKGSCIQKLQNLYPQNFENFRSKPVQ